MSFSSNLTAFNALFRGFARMSAHAALSPFSRSKRIKFLEASREHFQVYLRQPNLKQVVPETLIDNALPIKLEQYIRGRWQVTMVELTVIASLVQKRGPKKVFEIGTFDGRTTLNLWLNLPNSTIHTIDLPEGAPDSPGGNKPGHLIRKHVESGAIQQLFGNTLTFDFSPWYGTQDLVFVDADHSYRNALADSKTALRLVEGKEGIIVWHDYAVIGGVTQAVEEIVPLVKSEADFHWVEGTSLAILIPRPGHPIELDESIASPKVAAAPLAAAS